MSKLKPTGGVKYSAGQGAYALALKNNQMYAQHLSRSIAGTGKKVANVFAASALRQVVEATVHDSSRAAANWDLAFSGMGLRDFWAPMRYNTPPIGERGSSGSQKQAVIAWKMDWYAIEPMAGGLYRPTTGGRMAQFSRMCGAGAGASLQLFNPILNKATPKAELYARYAFSGDYDAFETVIAAHEDIDARMDGFFIPYLVDKLRQAVKVAHDYKNIDYTGFCP